MLTAVSSDASIAVMGLLERIEEIRNEKGWTQREFAREARLKNEKNLGVVYSRLRKNANAQIEHDTLVLLARAGGVSIDWLATGRAPKYIEPHIERPFRYPNFAATADFLRDTVPPEVINDVVEHFHGDDLDRETWRIKILAAHSGAKRNALKSPDQKAAEQKRTDERREVKRADVEVIAKREEQAHDEAWKELDRTHPKAGLPASSETKPKSSRKKGSR